MAKEFIFGIKSQEKAWRQVKTTLQCAHLNKTISKSTVYAANSWASAKWGKTIDYTNILRYVGVEIVED